MMGGKAPNGGYSSNLVLITPGSAIIKPSENYHSGREVQNMADRIVEGFRVLSTAVVADIFRHMEYPQQVMDPTILPFREGWKVCGRAFTQASLPAAKRSRG